MELRPNSDEALNRWLGPRTWHTQHPYDMNRWFEFVNAYQQEHGYEIDEVALREEIEHRHTKSGGSVGEDLRKIIREYISLAYNILDFLKHTGR